MRLTPVAPNGSAAADLGALPGETLVPFADMFPPESIHHHFAGQDDDRGVYAKEMHMRAGQMIITHAHDYAHMAVLVSGAVLLTVEGVGREVIGLAFLDIAKGKQHGIRAITDAVWVCVHPVDADANASNVDAVILGENV